MSLMTETGLESITIARTSFVIYPFPQLDSDTISFPAVPQPGARRPYIDAYKQAK